MEIFLSWSGEKSREIAEIFKKWLPLVVQNVEPWISTGIDKGKIWDEELAKKLNDCDIGIIILTKDNLKADWLLFESGALKKSKESNACTFLFDLSPTDVQKPLSIFQATKNDKEDVLKLLETINKKLGENGGKKLTDEVLNSTFDIFWPQLEEKFKEIKNRIPEEKKPIREPIELIPEILETVRRLERRYESTLSTSFAEVDHQNEPEIPKWRRTATGIRWMVEDDPRKKKKTMDEVDDDL